MSSTLTMVLMAAMAVPVSGPEMASGEMAGRVSFDGTWEGTLVFCGGMAAKVVLRNGRLAPVGDGMITFPCTFTDTGNGTVTLRLEGDVYEGIYRVEKGYSSSTASSPASDLLPNPSASRKDTP